MQSNNSFNESHSQAASGEQASELDMQEVQQVLDSADERTLQAEQRALKAEEAAQVPFKLHLLSLLHSAGVAQLDRLFLRMPGTCDVCSRRSPSHTAERAYLVVLCSLRRTCACRIAAVVGGSGRLMYFIFAQRAGPEQHSRDCCCLVAHVMFEAYEQHVLHCLRPLTVL